MCAGAARLLCQPCCQSRRPEAPHVSNNHDVQSSGTARVGKLDDQATSEDEVEGIVWRVDAIRGNFKQGYGDGDALLCTNMAYLTKTQHQNGTKCLQKRSALDGSTDSTNGANGTSSTNGTLGTHVTYSTNETNGTNDFVPFRGIYFENQPVPF